MRALEPPTLALEPLGQCPRGTTVTPDHRTHRSSPVPDRRGLYVAIPVDARYLNRSSVRSRSSATSSAITCFGSANWYFCREFEIALVMARHRHHGAGAVTHQHEVGDPHPGDLVAGDRMHRTGRPVSMPRFSWVSSSASDTGRRGFSSSRKASQTADWGTPAAFSASGCSPAMETKVTPIKRVRSRGEHGERFIKKNHNSVSPSTRELDLPALPSGRSSCAAWF